MERFQNNLERFYEDVRSIVPDLFQISNPDTPDTPDTSDKNNDNLDKSQCLEISLLDSPEDRLFFFVDNWFPHMDSVSSADLEYFAKNQVDPELFPSLPFLKVMTSVNSKNRDIIWEYLHTLFALSISTKCIKKRHENLDYKNLDTSTKSHYDAVLKTVDNFPSLIANMVSWKRDKNNKNDKHDDNDEIFKNSSVTKLAQEISEEINPDDFLNLQKDLENPSDLFKALLSGDESSVIGKLVKTVTTKLNTKMESGDIKQEDLLKDVNILLQNMGGQMGGQMGEGSPISANLSGIMNMAQTLTSSMGGMGGMKGLGDITKLFNGSKKNKKSKKSRKGKKKRRSKK